MSQPLSSTPGALSQQQAIRAKCVHPTGAFIAFAPEAIEQSIPNRFEQQVACHPDRLAVESRHQALTYAALNQMANRVARGVQARRGAAAEPIALLLDPGVAPTAALLGVLKAGKFYVPLDPTHPPARLTSILEDSQAGLIVTDTQHLPLAEAVGGHEQQVLNLDELDTGLSDENLDLTISPDTLAYLLYTSGSTGTPKGVLQNHRNVLHMIKNECNGFHLCADDRFSLLYSPSVVSAARITLSALLNGAALFPFNLREEGFTRLSSWLIQEGITFYNSAGTVFRHFAKTLTGEENFPHLRLIVLGSETIYKSDVELYRKHFPTSCLFVATLGATEITHIRKYFVDKEVSIPDRVVPVGYPEEGLQVLLLDESGQEVGVDTVGQIAVKSRYLNLGYWRRSDLNQTRFLPDPNGGDERIYLTGDLGRMHADGCLIHVGREDFQVKIRGNRVETGEIETALLDHPAVKETVVVGRKDRADEKCLVAYVVATQGATPTIGDLHRLLQAKLPDYMVPSAFVFLDALPLTPNGKVDRLALPVPSQSRPELYVAPRNIMEQTITDVWQELLGIEQVGIHDNFLNVGGDSLLALQVLARLRRAFQVEISVHAFFEAPTVAGLAEAIAKTKEDDSEAWALAIVPIPREAYRMMPSSLRAAQETGRTS